MILKVKEGVTDFVNRVKSTYDYLSGKTKHNLTGLVDATEKEIKSSSELLKLVKSFNKSGTDLDIKVDRGAKKFLVTFSATEVPKSLVKSMTDKNGQYYKNVVNYDSASKTVEMVFSADREFPDNEKGNVLGKDETSYSKIKNTARPNRKRESVMAPTPTPYKPHDKYDTSKDLVESDETETFEEVDSKMVYDSDGFLIDYVWYRSLKDGRNVFLLVDKDAVSPDEVNDYASDWETYDDDEAEEWFYDYGDDDGTSDVELESRNIGDEVTWRGKKHTIISQEEDDDTFILRPSDKVTDDTFDDPYSDDDGFDDVYLSKDQVDSLKESGNPFKSTHICQGCGKTLDKCTCPVPGEEEVNEDMSSSATQSSSVGQFKRSSIDLVSSDELEEECIDEEDS